MTRWGASGAGMAEALETRRAWKSARMARRKMYAKKRVRRGSRAFTTRSASALWRSLSEPCAVIEMARTERYSAASSIGPRPPMSWSSASAAIQPDIMTIGMPGPGLAAPPAR